MAFRARHLRKGQKTDGLRHDTLEKDKKRHGTLEKDKKPTGCRTVTDNPGASRSPSRKLGGPARVRNHFKMLSFPSLAPPGYEIILKRCLSRRSAWASFAPRHCPKKVRWPITRAPTQQQGHRASPRTGIAMHRLHEDKTIERDTVAIFVPGAVHNEHASQMGRFACRAVLRNTVTAQTPAYYSDDGNVALSLLGRFISTMLASRIS